MFAKTPVFSFGLTSVASFSFTLRTKADTAPVLIDWGDGTQSTHAGHYGSDGQPYLRGERDVCGQGVWADESVLTKFSTNAGRNVRCSGECQPGMTYFTVLAPTR